MKTSVTLADLTDQESKPGPNTKQVW